MYKASCTRLVQSMGSVIRTLAGSQTGVATHLNISTPHSYGIKHVHTYTGLFMIRWVVAPVGLPARSL